MSKHPIRMTLTPEGVGGDLLNPVEEVTMSNVTEERRTVDLSGFDLRDIAFAPKEDITTFELAQAVPLIARIEQKRMPGRVYDALPANVQRHFTVEDY